MCAKSKKSGYTKKSGPLGLTQIEVGNAWAETAVHFGTELTDNQKKAASEIAVIKHTTASFFEAKDAVLGVMKKYGIADEPKVSAYEKSPDEKKVNFAANQLLKTKKENDKKEEEKKIAETVAFVKLDGNSQPKSGEGVPPYNNTKSQKGHVQKYDAESLAKRTGVSVQRAQELKDAVYEQGVGGFSWGWDSAIRAYQAGKSASEILAMEGTKQAVMKHFGGDSKKYFDALKKKANDCEELIDRSPKWNGKELMRGFHGLSQQTIAALTNTDPDTVINLNLGTASWSTSLKEASKFGSKYNGLIAHVSGKRRGTSIKNASYFPHEQEVLCSRREAFRCLKVEKGSDGYLHAYYEVVDTDYDWSSVK